MGNVVVALMARMNARTQTPCTFVHKYGNYGVNNLPYSEAADDCSGVYRMKHFPDDVFDRLSHHLYYRCGNAVANLKVLCEKRGDAPAVAYRPVERIEQVMVPDPHAQPPPAADAANPNAPDNDSDHQQHPQQQKRTVPRFVTHYGPRATLSYAELWNTIEQFGVGLRAVVERNRSLAHRPTTSSAASAKNEATTAGAHAIHAERHAESSNAFVDGSHDDSTAGIPRNPRHAYQRVPLYGMSAPKIAIFEETRWEWVATIFGLWTQRFVAVTVYANLGEEALSYALEEADCEAIVCNGRSVPLLLQMMRKGRLPWTSLVYLDELPSDFTVPVDAEDGRRLAPLLVPWSSVTETGCGIIDSLAHDDAHRRHQGGCAEPGSAAAPAGTAGKWENEDPAAEAVVGHATDASRDWLPHLPTSNDHLALVMYTSGTTGKPKGVMHTHGSIAAGMQTLNDKLVWIEPYLPKESQTYCAFLPLAHIMEFICINIFLHRGFLVCFSNPRTLTNEFARPHGDFTEYRPLIIMAVPRIFEVLRKSVLASLPPSGTLKRRIFDQAYATRKEALARGFDTPYYNARVFAKVREAFGGRMVLMLSGGGLLSEATHEFVNVVMGFVVQGYGLTETIACGSTQLIGSLAYNNCGELMKTCEIKLRDTEYFKHTDAPEPRGEILLRGPFLFKGYYKQPQLTKEALDEDGWFHTGDVGSIAVSENNALRIVGRVKALAKNVNGEYIPIEALEAIYSGSELSLPNSTCLLVHPHRSYVCAIALTERKHVTAFLAKHPQVAAAVKDKSYPAILRDPVFCASAAESFRATAREAKRRPFEVVRHVRLFDDEWTPENGMLTAALKLKRARLESVYKDAIGELFLEE